MREFFFKSKNDLPNSSVSIKENSFVSINLQSVLFRVLRRVVVENKVVVTIKKTAWGGSRKFEDIAFENTKTFSIPNSRN